MVTKFHYAIYTDAKCPSLQVPVIRTFILNSGDEAQCTDKAI